MKRLSAKQKEYLISTTSVGIFFLLWQFLGYNRIISPLLISYPTQIFSSGITMFMSGEIYPHLWLSSQEFLIGYIAAAVVGILAGLAIGCSKSIYSICNPFITAFYIIPRFALIPLIILWLGIGLMSKSLVVFLGCVFPVLITLLSGVRSTDTHFITVARSFGASRVAIFRTVVLPFSMPYLLAGLRLAVGRGLLGVVVGELFGSDGGLGYLLTLYGSTFQTDKFMVVLLFFVVIGLVLTGGIELIEKHFAKGRPPLQA